MIGFISMDSRIVFVKCLFKGVRPEPVEFAEPFANKSIKHRVRPFLRTTLDDHVDELNLERMISFSSTKQKAKKVTYFLTLLQLNFEQLVNSFFVI